MRSRSSGMPRSVYQRRRSWHQYSNHFGPSGGGTKYSISICSNSRVRKMKLPGVISLRNDLPTWAMPNGGFLRANWRTFLKLMKMPWGLRAQVGDRAAVLDRTHRRLEHQVELARLGELAVGALARRLGGLLRALQLGQVVGAEALAAGLAVDHRVGEAGEVPAGLPHARVLEDRRVE